jgi:hypothetical protein
MRVCTPMVRSGSYTASWISASSILDRAWIGFKLMKDTPLFTLVCSLILHTEEMSDMSQPEIRGLFYARRPSYSLPYLHLHLQRRLVHCDQVLVMRHIFNRLDAYLTKYLRLMRCNWCLNFRQRTTKDKRGHPEHMIGDDQDLRLQARPRGSQKLLLGHWERGRAKSIS